MIEIIVNSKNKNSLREFEKIKSVLEENKIDYKTLFTTENNGASSLMEEVKGKEIVVVGGDGTMNEIVNNYHGENIIYFARGSGNDLAKSLRLDFVAEDIIKLISSSKFEVYDLGEVNGRKFCSGFDLGFNADVIARAGNSKLKKYFGKYIYLEKGIISILSLRKYYAKIKWNNGELITDKLLLLNVMVQPYEGGGIKFSDKATGSDGKFHIMIMENMSSWTFIYNYICLLMKRYKSLKNVKFIETNELSIETNQKYYQIDGELIVNNEHINLSCLSKCYKIKGK